VTPTDLLQQYNTLDNALVKRLVGDCLNTVPSARPRSSPLAQRLLDEYNDSCAKVASAQALVGDIIALTQICKELVNRCRTNREEGPARILTSTQTNLLFQYEDSWDEPVSLRLAPEICFLIGAGLFYGYINLEDVEQNRKVIANDMRSLKGVILAVISDL